MFELKREFQPADIAAWREKQKANPAAKPPNPTHATIRRAGKIMHFTQDWINQRVAEGILSVGGGKLVFKTAEGEPDVAYKILAGPGRYCCHCEEALGSQKEAQAHVAEKHAGVPSPDLRTLHGKLHGNPAGYRQDNFFNCELEGEPIGYAKKGA